ncbi:hypothetical protein HPG69_005125 [Diceros bicornis minor]|uniref:Uncharacterized protein n=1 Tax=Diceros bicornis minor TaxID=77932 RepID=A0A7J7EFY3_DICBM|nr:hypothetical protein HPG69_005125 [Diceros bicornis minor]
MKIQSLEEIQLLKPKLHILPNLHDEHVMQLHRKLFEEERHCSKIEKKLPNVCRNMKSTYQICNLYKKIARDTGKEVERNASYYPREILFHEKRGQES